MRKIDKNIFYKANESIESDNVYTNELDESSIDISENLFTKDPPSAYNKIFGNTYNDLVESAFSHNSITHHYPISGYINMYKPIKKLRQIKDIVLPNHITQKPNTSIRNYIPANNPIKEYNVPFASEVTDTFELKNNLLDIQRNLIDIELIPREYMPISHRQQGGYDDNKRTSESFESSSEKSASHNTSSHNVSSHDVSSQKHNVSSLYKSDISSTDSSISLLKVYSESSVDAYNPKITSSDMISITPALSQTITEIK